jgi:hypothetical protein
MDNIDIAAWYFQRVSAKAEAAHSEFLEVEKALMRLRFLSVLTFWVVISLVFPLFFSANIQNWPLLEPFSTLVGLFATLLSFFYSLLTLVYASLSSRRASLASYTTYTVPSYLAKLDPRLTLDEDPQEAARKDPQKAAHVSYLWSVAWLLQSVSIFVVPSVAWSMVWPFILVYNIRPAPSLSIYDGLMIPCLLHSEHPYVFGFYSVSETVTIVVLFVAFVHWRFYRKMGGRAGWRKTWFVGSWFALALALSWLWCWFRAFFWVFTSLGSLL